MCRRPPQAGQVRGSRCAVAIHKEHATRAEACVMGACRQRMARAAFAVQWW
jgi:hypothetical protein